MTLESSFTIVIFLYYWEIPKLKKNFKFDKNCDKSTTYCLFLSGKWSDSWQNDDLVSNNGQWAAKLNLDVAGACYR